MARQDQQRDRQYQQQRPKAAHPGVHLRTDDPAERSQNTAQEPGTNSGGEKTASAKGPRLRREFAC